MASKTPPFEPWPKWTTARAFGFIRSALRGAFNRYPPKYEAIKRAASLHPVLDPQGVHVRYKSGPRAGTRKHVNKYRCASCNELFAQNAVQVDHIIPAGSLKTFSDLPEFARKLFCSVDGLQILCKPCHTIKTKEDKE